MSDVVKIYNPANAAGLTPEQISALPNLTVEEITQLSKAYPRAAYPDAYLLIVDKSLPVDKQLPTLSHWPGLYNLIVRNGMKNYGAINFKANYKPPVRNLNPRTVNGKKKAEVLDLSEVELMSLPGFKAGNEKIPAEKIVVKKVNRGRPKKEQIKSENNA